MYRIVLMLHIILRWHCGVNRGRCLAPLIIFMASFILHNQAGLTRRVIPSITSTPWHRFKRPEKLMVRRDLVGEKLIRIRMFYKSAFCLIYFKRYGYHSFPFNLSSFTLKDITDEIVKVLFSESTFCTVRILTSNLQTTTYKVHRRGYRNVKLCLPFEMKDSRSFKGLIKKSLSRPSPRTLCIVSPRAIYTECRFVVLRDLK